MLSVLGVVGKDSPYSPRKFNRVFTHQREPPFSRKFLWELLLIFIIFTYVFKDTPDSLPDPYSIVLSDSNKLYGVNYKNRMLVLFFECMLLSEGKYLSSIVPALSYSPTAQKFVSTKEYL